MAAPVTPAGSYRPRRPPVAGAPRNPDAIERIRGWRDELAARGLVPEEPGHGDWSAPSGHEIGTVLEAEPDTAVFVGNDHMAIGLLSALRGRGLRVPEDVGVVGFDDVPEAAYLAPALTTVRQDFRALGELMMQKVLLAVEEPDGLSEDTPIATHLIVRESARRLD
ncbi:DNA-binding LacI/PurR family transcriptional regulator [Microbacterium marinum]|uniref:DNA-binding LacI/PurR family transcriptional regulator n=1 Tax=Microbacterium marinum TaxID=421115 RepID=A0A7W7BPV0_9MICO|nr:DNA-binding LacI/PurR family transcriptional regulator [Microbacterium marinum]